MLAKKALLIHTSLNFINFDCWKVSECSIYRCFKKILHFHKLAQSLWWKIISASQANKVFANFRKNKSILSLTINLSKKGMLIFNISCLSKTISNNKNYLSCHYILRFWITKPLSAQKSFFLWSYIITKYTIFSGSLLLDVPK